MKSYVSFLLSFALICSSLPVSGQTGNQPQQQSGSVRVGTVEVSLDVVVRDKKGRPVKDLSAADFEVYEDGVRQQVESFRLVSRESGTSDKTTTSNETKTGTVVPRESQPSRTSTPGVIALVFDRLSTEARALARRAAVAYADEGLTNQDYTGVFGIDLGLRTIQPYTDNAQLVKKAIEEATTRATSTFVSNTERVRNLSDRSASLTNQGEAGAAGAASAGGSRDGMGAAAAGQAGGQAIVEQALVRMQMNMAETFESLERNQQGYATVNSLLAVVNSMRNLPGRKTVIFFSEGLALPPPVIEQFRSVINAANRANVSVYAVDSTGLRIDSTTLETTREINAMAQRRMNQVHRSVDDTSGPMMKALERNEDLLKLDPHHGLNDLADQTGGFVIRNTNDLMTGLRRIDEDMRMHYLLTYTPKNQEYDGKFRQISVKLSRNNLDVQTRKGYFAVDNSLSSPVLNYEAPALAALSAKRNTGGTAIRAKGLTFPESSRLGLTPIIVEVPANGFSYKTDTEKKTFSTDFSILVLIRDESKQVIEKLSQHYALTGPADHLEAAKKGEILFYREPELPPGRYTIEAVAYDAPTGKSSIRTTTLEVPDVDDAKLRVSSLVLIKRADRLTQEERKKANPLHFGEIVMYPNLGEPLRKSAVKQLPFFFTVWPAKGSQEKPKLTVSILQNGRSLGQIPSALPDVDETGVIKYASSFPLDKFPAGTYELRVTVQDGQSDISRSAQFMIEQ